MKENLFLEVFTDKNNQYNRMKIDNEHVRKDSIISVNVDQVAMVSLKTNEKIGLTTFAKDPDNQLILSAIKMKNVDEFEDVDQLREKKPYFDSSEQIYLLESSIFRDEYYMVVDRKITLINHSNNGHQVGITADECINRDMNPAPYSIFLPAVEKRHLNLFPKLVGAVLCDTKLRILKLWQKPYKMVMKIGASLTLGVRRFPQSQGGMIGTNFDGFLIPVGSTIGTIRLYLTLKILGKEGVFQ